jgi:hypothetical protein
MRVIGALARPHPVDQLAVSADGRFAAVASDQAGQLVVVGLQDGRRSEEVPFQDARQLTFAPGGVTLAAAHPGGVSVLPNDGSADYRQIPLGPSFGGGIAFDPDGRHLLTTVTIPPPAYSYDPRPRGRLDRWTVPGWRHIPGPEIATTFDRLAVSPDGDLFGGVNADGFELRYTNSGGLSARHDSFRRLASRFGSAAQIRPPTVRFVTFDPRGEAVVFGWDDEFRAADARTGRELRRVRPLGRWFLDAAYTGSGRHLGTVDGTTRLVLWDADTWQVAQEYDWGAGNLHRLAFAADGLTGVCGTADGRLVIFDLDD